MVSFALTTRALDEAFSSPRQISGRVSQHPDTQCGTRKEIREEQAWETHWEGFKGSGKLYKKVSV